MLFVDTTSDQTVCGFQDLDVKATDLGRLTKNYSKFQTGTI